MMNSTYELGTPFIVNAEGHLSLFDIKILVRLYQPIIGHQSFALYMTLWSDYLGETRIDTKVDLTLQRLVDQLQLSIDQLHIARRTLEAYGLIDTFVNESKKTLRFIMRNPLPAKDFFANDILLLSLQARLGKDEFQRTKAYFIAPTVVDSLETKITATLDSLIDVPASTAPVVSEHQWRGATTNAPQGSLKRADILKYFKTYQLPERLLTVQVFEKLSAISTLYRFDLEQLMMLVNRSLIGQGIDRTIPLDALDSAATSLSRTITKTTPVAIKENKLNSNAHSTERTPIEHLTLRNDGRPPLNVDVYLIVNTQQKTGLTNSVMNVVIDYVLLKQSGNLPTAYFEKVATHLMRQKVTDPEVAQVLLNNFGVKKSSEQESSPSDTVTNEKTVSTPTPSDEDIANLLNERSQRLKRGKQS